jgi:hypothetical protein
MRAREEAGGDRAGVIEVDFTALTHLVGVLRALADELAGNGALCGHVNDPDLADAFARVERNWNKQRVTLQTFLDSAVDSVTVSLARYRHLEMELEQAAGSRR